MKNKKLTILLTLFIFMKMTQINAQTSDETKFINNLINQMTLDEKISMIHANSKFTSAGVERLNIPEWKLSDGPHGVREEINRDDWDPAGLDNDFATYLPVGTALAATWNPDLELVAGGPKSESQLGIPIGNPNLGFQVGIPISDANMESQTGRHWNSKL